MAFFSMIDGADITIGSVKLKEVNEVTIEKSWEKVTDTATIIFPKNVQFSDKATESLTEVIKKGDPVSIKLRYDGHDFYEEFTGYVRAIDLTVPVTIECDDEMYQLKRKSFSKSWKNARLQEVIDLIAPDYETEIADISLGQFEIEKANGAKVLTKISSDYGIKTFFRGKKLIAGFPYRFTPQETVYVYDMQQNVAVYSNLN